MAKKQNQLECWLIQATLNIRCTPNRKAAEKELREHLEDKLFDLKRFYPDMTEEELQTRALNQMGDAEEISRTLAKVHNSWMDILWTISNLLMWPLVVIFAVVAAFWAVWTPILSFDWEFRDGFVEMFVGDLHTPSEPYTELAASEERALVDDHLIVMEKAYLYESETWEGDWEWTLQLVMNAHSTYFWVASNNFIYKITAVDSLGNEWVSHRQYYALPTEEPETNDVSFVRSWEHDSGLLSSPFSNRFTLRLNNIDPDAQWVRVEYDWMGRSFDFTVDLKEGAE